MVILELIMGNSSAEVQLSRSGVQYSFNSLLQGVLKGDSHLTDIFLLFVLNDSPTEMTMAEMREAIASETTAEVPKTLLKMVVQLIEAKQAGTKFTEAQARQSAKEKFSYFAKRAMRSLAKISDGSELFSSEEEAHYRNAQRLANECSAKDVTGHINYLQGWIAGNTGVGEHRFRSMTHTRWDEASCHYEDAGATNAAALYAMALLRLKKGDNKKENTLAPMLQAANLGYPPAMLFLGALRLDLELSSREAMQGYTMEQFFLRKARENLFKNPVITKMDLFQAQHYLEQAKDVIDIIGLDVAEELKVILGFPLVSINTASVIEPTPVAISYVIVTEDLGGLDSVEQKKNEIKASAPRALASGSSAEALLAISPVVPTDEPEQEPGPAVFEMERMASPA